MSIATHKHETSASIPRRDEQKRVNRLAREALDELEAEFVSLTNALRRNRRARQALSHVVAHGMQQDQAE